MKKLLARFMTAEHYILNSAFLLGAFGTLVDYLHATPLPPEWAHAAFTMAGVLKMLDYARLAWQKKQTNG